MHFGKINVQIADGVVLELLFRRALPLFAQRQAADAVALKTAAVQRRAGKAGNRRLKGVQTVIERQQHMLAEGHGNGFFRRCEHRRDGFGTRHRIGRRQTFAPLGYRFGIDVMTNGERL